MDQHNRMSVSEVLRSYAKGRRDFQKIIVPRPDFSRHEKVPTDLSGADFSGSRLEQANFVGVKLFQTKFCAARVWDSNFARSDARHADFRLAQVSWSNFNLADLSHANLSNAEMYMPYFRDTDLSRTILSGANFQGSNMHRARIDRAKISRVKLSEAVLADIILEPFLDAKILDKSSFVVDWKSVVKSTNSERAKLKDFLILSGMPAVTAEYIIDCAHAIDKFELRSLMQSTFICYGDPDKPFATALRDELHKNGVNTFYFHEDAPAGEKIRRVMHDKINTYDRVILICSRTSLDRKAVLVEIEETLAREARDGGASYLIPITLDDYVFQDWSPSNPDIKNSIQDRVVADFRNTQNHPVRLRKSIVRLVQVLKKKPIVPDSIVH